MTNPAPTPHELRPARALLTPTWIGALAVLVANDHFLKGAGILPGFLTGKLSDFAGMLVAPALLATILFAVGLRGRRVLLACHVAVAAVFAGIQLSPAFAGQWSALMAGLGHPWLITCDPWDLIALPFLGLSWVLLVPEMDGARPALAPLQRTAVAGLSVFGLWSTVATSQAEPFIDGDGEWYEDVLGQAYINNANDFDIALHIRPLRDDLSLECEQISADPGRLLNADAFGEAEHWSLPARTNVALDLTDFGGCGAAWVAGEGIEPKIVFIDELDSVARQWWPGQTFDGQDLGGLGLAITFDEGGRGQWSGDEGLLHTPRTDAPEQPEVCEFDAGELRFDWPLELPNRPVRVISIEPGVDGCFALELQPVSASDEGPVDEGEPREFYLCAPAAAVPFAAGELLDFDEAYGSTGARELNVTLLDETLVPAESQPDVIARRVRYLRGGNDPLLIGPAFGESLVAVDNVSCPWQVDDSGCASVERRVDLAITGGSEYLEPGVPMVFPDGSWERSVVLGYARQQAVVDTACAEGSLALRYDIDLAVIESSL